MKKEENEIIEQDGISLTKKVMETIKRNKNKIMHELYILNKTSTMIDSILATPRNLLQLDSPILVEALEDERCQEVFKKCQEEVKKMKKDDLPPLMYDILTNLDCTEQSIVNCIAVAQYERKEFRNAIREDNVFKIAKSIWVLGAFTTSIACYVDASFSFFEGTELLDMYKLLALTSKIYADQVMKMSHLMYEDEEDN